MLRDVLRDVLRVFVHGGGWRRVPTDIRSVQFVKSVHSALHFGGRFLLRGEPSPSAP